jgi:hypothetical protein
MATTSAKKATVAAPARKPAADPRRAAKAPPAGKPATKPASATAKATKPAYKLSEILPEDSFIRQTGEKSFFVAYYSTFTPEGETKPRNMVIMSKGYLKDGELRVSGRSATLPQELLNDPKTGIAFIEEYAAWLAEFVQEKPAKKK